jgi:Flp pilus assembly pilin Flp
MRERIVRFYREEDTASAVVGLIAGAIAMAVTVVVQHSAVFSIITS